MATSTKDKDKTPEETPEGLDALGNPADKAYPAATRPSGVAHQDGGSSQAQRDAADEANAKGFIGVGVPDKADLSQANPDVMNGGK